MTRLLILVLGASFLFGTLAFAAGPYDGNWSGEANGVMSAQGHSGSGLCSGTITATVKDNVVNGAMQAGRANPGFGGRIEADGSFKGHVGQFPATGKFSGSSFDGSYTSNANCADWRITMKRSGAN